MPLYDSKAAFVLEAIHSAEVKKSTLSDYEVKKPDTKWVDPKINLSLLWGEWLKQLPIRAQGIADWYITW